MQCFKSVVDLKKEGLKNDAMMQERSIKNDLSCIIKETKHSSVLSCYQAIKWPLSVVISVIDMG